MSFNIRERGTSYSLIRSPYRPLTSSVKISNMKYNYNFEINFFPIAYLYIFINLLDRPMIEKLSIFCKVNCKEKQRVLEQAQLPYTHSHVQQKNQKDGKGTKRDYTKIADLGRSDGSKSTLPDHVNRGSPLTKH